ncbi:MAG: hypothetical protein NTW87_29570 [Planctomycetota bacterium]|nr:hypothetical protein [Planctomycetota bacterium]
MIGFWRKSGTVPLLAVLGFFGTAALLGAVEDHIIKYKNKEVVPGEIKKADLDQVEILYRDQKTGNASPIGFGAAEIASIEWDIQDPDWRSGMAAFEGGQYGQAAQRFQSVVAGEDFDKFRAAAKPAAYYYCAESLYRSNKLGDAVPMFKKLVSDYKSSFYVPKAVGSLVDAAIQTSKMDEVPALLGQLTQMGGEQRVLANYYEGQVFLAQDKVKQAEEKFAAAGAGTSVPATRGMALMGQAQCAIAAGDLARARDLAKRALQAEPPASVAGAAHLIIGNALVAEADKEKAAGEALQNKLMDALLEYMRVQEQYRGDPRTEPESIFKAGNCLERLYKSNPTSRGGDRHRAMYMYNKLTNDARYRSSRWAVQASEAIKNLR